MIRNTRRPSSVSSRTSDDARWAAVAARDSAFDGRFFYSVATTGVYCRPGCPARTAKRSNIAFHATAADAIAAGFRPCKRCKPDQLSHQSQYVAKVLQACRFIETADEAPSLKFLAESAGVSPHHFHRIFKSIAGVTPKAYAVAHRNQRVRANLSESKSVTDAIYKSGFNSNGRFYAGASQILGMTPQEFQSGGPDVEMKFALAQCSLGAILVAATDKGISAIFLGDEPEALLRDLQDRFRRALLLGGNKKFDRLVAKVVGLIERPGRSLDLPLDVRGTAFQHQVWAALRTIPHGATASYTDIAQRIGKPKSVRAVAQACGANPVAVVIPCHRVVRNDGAISGYRWGVERKRALLKRESNS